MYYINMHWWINVEISQLRVFTRSYIEAQQDPSSGAGASEVILKDMDEPMQNISLEWWCYYNNNNKKTVS